MKQNTLNDNDDTEKTCHDLNITNKELQAAYLWMKQMKDRLEKSKYEESKIYCVDDKGQIVGWTEIAARSSKGPHSSLLNKNLSDFLRITDGRPFRDIFPLVKPGFPYLINVHFTDGSVNTSVYTVKITSLLFEGRNLFYLVFYGPLEEEYVNNL